MKKLTLLSFIATLGLLAFTIKPAEDKFTVDTEKSSIEWSAKKVGGGHTGTVRIASGSLIFDGNNLKTGTFAMDMSTIIVEGNNKNLLDHLKSDDFFGVVKNPSSSFVITKVAPAGDQLNITGNLTIKGITNPVTFPAAVKKNGNIVVAVAKGIKIDRTKFDIKFRSASFFSSIGNQAIEDNFELSVNLVAKK